jgi:transaldolase / glucose-6-phosphate isomerase
VVLGAAIGAAAQAGRDKLTLVISPDLASFGSWIEQLVAESSGKDGKGIVPVDLEPLGPPDSYGDDRFFVYMRSGAADAKQDAAVAALEKAGQPVVTIAVDRREALGREIYRWEMATAIACAALGVNPFDEPNVTEAKVATSALLAQHAAEGKLPVPDDACDVRDVDRIRAHLATATPADYLAFCAYFLRTPERDALLTRLRVACRDRTRNATTVGYGPRFLHSTGQLHKGGPNTGVFLQLTAEAQADLPVPGESYTFATLRDAQALGDLQVLKRRGRRVLRVHLGADVDAGLETLTDALAGETRARARKSA